MPKTKPDAGRYLSAALAAVAALLIRELLNPLLGTQNAYHTAWLAIVFTAWYCGIGPSIVAIAIVLTGIWYWFLPPYHSFGVKDPHEIFGMAGFLVFSAVIVALGDSTRRIVVKRGEAEEEVTKAHRELEDRVKERTLELEQKTAEVVEKAMLLDLANDAIFVKTASGTISYWNQGAERLYGWSMAEAIGKTPHELLKTEYPIPTQVIESQDNWEGELRHTRRDGTQLVVSSRWTTLRDSSGKPVGWLESCTDITLRQRAEQAARSLSGRILNLQDDERRRIARELHDSLGQYLTALKMNLDLFQMSNSNHAAIAKDCSEILDKCLAETRTLSHLLHPPLLDESGFGSAARWYVDGFAQRSGITVNLDLPTELGRLHKDVEIALFRAVQEGLTNVHRHSGGTVVDIKLNADAEQVQLEIKDNGRGIPENRLNGLREGAAETGVGLAGMRERMRELGGSLQIQSNNGGTNLLVTVPVIEEENEPESSPNGPPKNSAA
jgi:PAS domain S-box-containing protein